MQKIQEVLVTAMEIVSELPAPSFEYDEFLTSQIVFRGQMGMLPKCVKHRQGLQILWY